ncbi:hypothetical protein H5410_036824 [Solanum commersonii]|uniref:Uncharacterized protein n=1 Tax=Solanum commersonii TaxID=4109 RepID=A0A9J5Y7P7_SOLCO|nr:hypothetical protein H5410_036824 [Solanum commersonii]
MCCEGSLGAVSQGRCTRRPTLWSASSPYSSCLQHLRILDHRHTGTLGEVKAFGDSLNALGDPQTFFSSSFQPFCSFLPIRQFKKDVSNSATQDSIMNAHTRLNLLMQRSNVHSKFQVVTYHYQRISSSLYFLQLQVQAQQRKSNALT